MSNDFSINLRYDLIKQLYDKAKEEGNIEVTVDNNVTLFDLGYLNDIGFIDCKGYTICGERKIVKLKSPLIEYIELVEESIE